MLQDSFLPHVEDGTIVLLGATTENPSFQVNNALLSRCKVVVLEKHSVEVIEAILRRALVMLDVSEVDGEQEKQLDRQARFFLVYLGTLTGTRTNLCGFD